MLQRRRCARRGAFQGPAASPSGQAQAVKAAHDDERSEGGREHDFARRGSRYRSAILRSRDLANVQPCAERRAIDVGVSGRALSATPLPDPAARTVLVALPAQGPPTLGPAPPAALPASGSCTPVSPLKPLLPPAIAQHGLSNDGPSASRPSESQIELRKVVAADCTPARGQGGGGSSAEGNKIEVCADDKGDEDPLGPNGSAKAGASSTVIKAPRDAQKPLLPSWVVSSRASQGRQLRDELEVLSPAGSFLVRIDTSYVS